MAHSSCSSSQEGPRIEGPRIEGPCVLSKPAVVCNARKMQRVSSAPHRVDDAVVDRLAGLARVLLSTVQPQRSFRFRPPPGLDLSNKVAVVTGEQGNARCHGGNARRMHACGRWACMHAPPMHAHAINGNDMCAGCVGV